MTSALYKQLGGVVPGAALTNLYTVPNGVMAIVATVAVCNMGATTATFRIAVAPGGAADDPSHYLYYEATLNGYDTLMLTAGICLGPADVVRVRASTSTVTFRAWGQEFTP